MGKLSDNLQWALAAVETTYGTDPTPTEAIVLRPGISSDPVREAVERARSKATYSGEPHGVIDSHIEYSFTAALGGIEDTDGGVIALDPLMRAGGLTATTSGTSAGDDLQVEYTPSSTGHESATIYRYLTDRDTGNVTLLKMLGCRHSISITLGLNSEIQVAFEGRALYAEWEDLASVSGPSNYGISDSLLCSGLSLSFDSASYSASDFEFSTGFEVAQVDEITGSSNVEEVILNRPDEGGRPSGSFNPVMKASAFGADAFLDDTREGTEGSLSLTLDDGTYSFKITADNAQLGQQPGFESAGGYSRFSTDFFCNEGTSGGDDDFTIHVGQTGT
jgi:hypothetical protein